MFFVKFPVFLLSEKLKHHIQDEHRHRVPPPHESFCLGGTQQISSGSRTLPRHHIRKFDIRH